MSKYNQHYSLNLSKNLKFTDCEDIERRIQIIFNRYKSLRPNPDRNLDQFHATPKTVAKRVALLLCIDKIEEKKVIFLGDDDLTSIAFASMVKPKKTTVLDIDNRIIEFIQKVAYSEKLKIDTQKDDFRNPLNRERRDSYDLVFFDPAYTPNGLSTWLRRAIELTLPSVQELEYKKPEYIGEIIYIFCYGYTDRSTERGLKVQEIVSHYGLIIQDKIRGFNEYRGARDIGSMSDLYILQPTPRVTLKHMAPQGMFYTGQVR